MKTSFFLKQLKTCKPKHVFVMMLVFVLGFSCVYSQTSIKTVNGTVSDKTGNKLEGVSIKLKGSTIATTTNKDGNFIIKVPSSQKQPILVFSSLSYASQELSVSSVTTIDVSLTEIANSLNDVVVIGYGTVKKKDVTGSVGRVNVEDLQKAPVASIDAALAGRVAGVQVTSSDGQPGSNAEIVIRDVGSVTQSSAPLYVIDGFPQEDANFNSINPAEIESIEVLKDASSTAIYGARGSNGVIIITTKRGKSAKPVLTYNGYYGVQTPTKLMSMLSPYEYVRLENDINPFYANYVYFANGKTLQDYKNAPSVNWQDMCLNKDPAMQNHSISLSGRSNKTAYTLSASYTDQMGLIINSGFKRFQTRFSLDQEVNDKLKIGINVNYSTSTSYGQTPSAQATPPGQVVSNSAWNYMYNVWAYMPVQSARATSLNFLNTIVDNNIDDGGLPNGSVNPYLTALNEVNNRYSNTLTANAYLQYQISPDLIFRATAGENYITNQTDVFHNSQTNSGSPLTTYGATYGVNGSTSTTKTYSFLNENTLAYNRKFNNNNLLNAVVGFTTQLNNNNTFGFGSTNLPNEALGLSGLGQGTPYTVSSGSSLSAMQSYLGRVNYTFKTNYLFTASFRADGSSKFYTGNKWGYFPSGAVAWRFGNEEFMQKYKFVNDAKIRVSYGATGNNRVSDFAYASLLSSNAGGTLSGSYYSFNETNVYNMVVSQMSNKNLKWETSYQSDLGLDLTLFSNKINFSFDYYDKITKNLLINASMPYSTGFSSTYVNVGSVSNQGVEFSLSTTNIASKNFTWTTSFNISFNQNKVLSLIGGQDALLSAKNIGSQLSQFDYIAKVGQPVAQFYGYIADGMYQYSDFYKVPNGSTGNFFYVLKEGIPYYGTKSTLASVNTTVSAATSVQPGDPKFKDLNGDGLLNASDYTTIGKPYPKNYGGLTNNFTYKGFDLNIFFQWSYGNQILDANRIQMEGGTSGPQSGSSYTVNLGNVNNNQFATYVNRWSPTNPSNLYPRVNSNAGGTRQYSTRIVEDGSYLRLKTLQLGYNLPAKLLRRANISTARLYISGQNLFTLTGYSGPDPEVSTASSNTLTPGFDYSPYPRTKVITIGAVISL